jgi:hypothetical protein
MGCNEMPNFFGHIGLSFPGETQARWYPISMDERARLVERLAPGCSFQSLLFVKTMNNRLVCFNPKRMKRIWLLDDADESPEEDFDVSNGIDGYIGHSLEVYRALSEWLDGGTEINSSATEADRAAADAIIKAGAFDERREELRTHLRDTIIHFVDGTMDRYEVDRRNLHDLLDIEWDSEAEVVEISSTDAKFQSYYSLDMLRMIDLPFTELAMHKGENGDSR